MSPTTQCVCTEVGNIADHAARIRALEDAVRTLADKYDRFQWMLTGALATGIVNLVVLLAKR